MRTPKRLPITEPIPPNRLVPPTIAAVMTVVFWDVSAGLIILIPAVNRVMQQRLFKAALDELAVIGEPVNRVLEVDLNRDEVTLTLYDLPSTTP